MTTQAQETSSRKPQYLANTILLSAGALSTWGAIELAGGDTFASQALVGGLVAGVEFGLLILIRLAACETGRMRWIYLAAALSCLALSLVDQYAFLLSRASGMEERATRSISTAQSASADEATLRAELATWTATLSRELTSGEGPRARSARERVDALRAQLTNLQATATAAAQIHEHRAPLLVACDRFGISPDHAIKGMLAAVLLIGNGTGFLLLFASHRKVEIHSEAPQKKPQTPPANSANRVNSVEKSPSPTLTYKFPPAPWLQTCRANLMKACAPKELDIKLGHRPALSA